MIGKRKITDRPPHVLPYIPFDTFHFQCEVPMKHYASGKPELSTYDRLLENLFRYYI